MSIMHGDMMNFAIVVINSIIPCMTMANCSQEHKHSLLYNVVKQN